MMGVLPAAVCVLAVAAPAHTEGRRIPAAGAPAAQVAHAIASQIINSSPDAQKEFRRWGYGQSIILDAMMMASEQLGEDFMTVPRSNSSAGDTATVMSAWVNPLLDGFLELGQPAHDLAAGRVPPSTGGDKAIGDHIGLFPHAYLHRAVYYAGANSSRPAPLHYDRALDVVVARTTVDDFILKWPIRWTDGTITRDQPGDDGMDAIGWFNTSSHNFVWGDDAYMGLTLPARMILAGLDTEDFKYAQLCAKQSHLSVTHLRDAADELLWHGVDAKAGKHSCCKWGRANGWTLMMQAEVLDALSQSAWPGANGAVKAGKAAFVKHCNALAKVQSNDGRWHQVLTNRSTYLESSGTAMYALRTIFASQAVVAIICDAAHKVIRIGHYTLARCGAGTSWRWLWASIAGGWTPPSSALWWSMRGLA